MTAALARLACRGLAAQPQPAPLPLPRPRDWIVTVSWMTERDQQVTTVLCLSLPAGQVPQPESHVPEGCRLLRADVLPASRLDDMGPEQRQRYATQFGEYVRWRLLRARQVLDTSIAAAINTGTVVDHAVEQAVARWVQPLQFEEVGHG